MIYSNQISQALNYFHAYLDENLKMCTSHPAARVSSFWSEHFADRQNYPDVHKFLTFRRGDFVYGIGDTGPATPAQKKQEYDDICKSILLFTPAEFIKQLREPIIGAPLVYSFEDTSLSASFVLNAGTSWRVTQLLKEYGNINKPLHICEIGAGWGACATQLHQAADVASYTIIDLPENLCLSSTCLAVGMPERKTHFVSCAPGNIYPPLENTLNFGLPPAIDNLAGPYDLIINTMSFQEMDLETVNTYIHWASKVLAPGGLLISFNSHDKAGIQRASQYMYSDLHLVHMSPFRKVPSGYFNTIPYEMVFRRATAPPNAWVASSVDIVGELIQLGLDTDLVNLTRHVLASTPSQETVELMELLQPFFYAETVVEREAAADQIASRKDVISSYLIGCYFYAQGKKQAAQKLLELSLSLGLHDFACIRAQVLLSTMRQSSPAVIPKTLSAGLTGEIQKITQTSNVIGLQSHIARVLDCSIKTPSSALSFLKRIRARLKK